MELESLQTQDNSELSRFELKNGDEVLAFIDYKIGKSGNWYLIHTEVVYKEQKGIGSKIVKETLAIIDERGDKLIPSCPFVKAYIKRHPEEYMHLLADGVKL